MKNRYLLLASLVICGVLLVGCGAGKEDSLNNAEISVENEQTGTQEETNQSEQTQDTAENGQEQAPYVLTFEASTVEGEAMTSDIFAESKLTMINVWATYCNPCLAEMPALGEIAGSYDKAEFQMIGIVSDVAEGATEDDMNTVKGLIEETQANYPHLLLNESLYVNLVGAVEAVPTTFFFNGKGELMGYLVGSYEKEAWEEIIANLLDEVS